MTDHITRLKEALEAGPTPGPWSIELAGGLTYVVTVYHLVAMVCTPKDTPANAAFIAAANPAAIRELLAYVESLERDSRNRDMWKAQCEAQAVELSALRAKLEQAEKQRDAFREALEQLAAQSSGKVASTSKADCMAAWAHAAIASQEGGK